MKNTCVACGKDVSDLGTQICWECSRKCCTDDVLYPYRDKAIVAATELFYSEKVIERLKSAESDNEIERIMVDARKGILV